MSHRLARARLKERAERGQDAVEASQLKPVGEGQPRLQLRHTGQTDQPAERGRGSRIVDQGDVTAQARLRAQRVKRSQNPPVLSMRLAASASEPL